MTETMVQAEYQRRVRLIQDLMDAMELDAVLLTSVAMQASQLCVKFFSNYTLNTRRAYIFCAKGEEPYLIVPTVGQQYHARNITWLPAENVLCGDMLAIVEQKLTGHRSVGWYQPEELPVGVYRRLTAGDIRWTDITEALTKARANKSEYEIMLTKETSKLCADSFAYLLSLLRPGVTEEELIGAAEGYLRAHGASDSLVLTRSQKPHTFISRAQPVPIQEDGVFVYSAEVAGRGGYWSQMVRPVFMREDAQPEARKILEAGKAAEAAGLELLRPGYRVCDVSERIEQTVRDCGYGTGVWCGHGMGPDLGDAVDFGASNTMEIVPNMIITLHPSITGASDGLLYGNTFLTTEGDPIKLTDWFNGSPVLADLKKEAGLA
jgi:Xaa-Pro aminopeptidase